MREHGIPSLKLIWHLKMDCWNISFLLGWPIFRCYVSFRECKVSSYQLIIDMSSYQFVFHRHVCPAGPVMTLRRWAVPRGADTEPHRADEVGSTHGFFSRNGEVSENAEM